MLILSPLEQFQIVSLLSIKLGKLDFSITNSLLISIITLICFSSIIYLSSSNKNLTKERKNHVMPDASLRCFRTRSSVIAQDNLKICSGLKGARLFTSKQFTVGPENNKTVNGES